MSFQVTLIIKGMIAAAAAISLFTSAAYAEITLEGDEHSDEHSPACLDDNGDPLPDATPIAISYLREDPATVHHLEAVCCSGGDWYTAPLSPVTLPPGALPDLSDSRFWDEAWAVCDD